MTTRSTLAIVAVALSVLMFSTLPLAGAQIGQGILYQYRIADKQVTLTTPTVDIRVSAGGAVPHFMFWSPVVPPTARIIYHVQFFQLFEFNDTNDNQTYDNGTDFIYDPVLGLGRVLWDFSGFQTEESDGIVTAVHFNYTLIGIQGSGPPYPDLYMELRCHINTTNDNELKFDIVISGWPWLHNDSFLALRWDLMVQSPGMHTYRHAYQHRYENRTYAFDDAYFAYRHSANVGNDTTEVTSNYEDHPEKTMFYLVYPYFGDEVLVHDPIIGIEPVIVPDALLPTLIVIGAGALACIVIGAAIWARRRNTTPTTPG
jgi:hypothetical protein